MILSKYSFNTYILKETNQQINLEHLNIVINEILKFRKELEKNATVKRAIRYLNYIVISGYASLSNNILQKLIEQFLIECQFSYKIQTLPDVDIQKIKHILPVLSKRKNEQCGGTTADTSSIDPGVEPLCKAINSFKGIETFSSCEGHIKNNDGTFYILFTHDNKENLDKFTLALWESLEALFEKFPDTPEPQLRFDFGHWPHLKCTYFEFRLKYRAKEQSFVFNTMNILAKLLKEKQ